jgi:chromate transporter
VNAASLSLMAVVTLQLGWAALIDRMTVILLITSLVLPTRFHINSAWLVLGEALFALLILAWNKI